MYNGIRKIEEALDYIEENLTSDISCDILAKKMNLSVYEFRRIFAFLIECPLSEYIRKRRLSVAACEIMKNKTVSLTQISEKYGYSNQSSFSKAFKEQHGFSPSACIEGVAITLFSRPKFDFKINSVENISIRIKEDTEFFIKGFTGMSDITDTCCCEDIWSGFYDNKIDATLNCDKIYVSYKNQGEQVKCTIGERCSDGEKIPASKWACFSMNTTDDDIVNKMYSKIIYDWLPAAKLEKIDNLPIIEVFPFDMSEDGFEWDICIPIK